MPVFPRISRTELFSVTIVLVLYFGELVQPFQLRMILISRTVGRPRLSICLTRSTQPYLLPELNCGFAQTRGAFGAYLC